MEKTNKIENILELCGQMEGMLDTKDELSEIVKEASFEDSDEIREDDLGDVTGGGQQAMIRVRDIIMRQIRLA